MAKRKVWTPWSFIIHSVTMSYDTELTYFVSLCPSRTFILNPFDLLLTHNEQCQINNRKWISNNLSLISLRKQNENHLRNCIQPSKTNINLTFKQLKDTIDSDITHNMITPFKHNSKLFNKIFSNHRHHTNCNHN
jgi:hypothetical protein